MADNKMEKDFHHPYEPYEIQKEFMAALYNCIESGKGKSLSLICGSLTWLREHKRKDFEASLGEGEDKDEPDWIKEQARKSKQEAAHRQRAALEERLARARDKERRVRERFENGESRAKRQKLADGQEDSSENDDMFLLDEYESEGEDLRTTRKTDPVLSTETQAMLEKLGMSSSENVEDQSRDSVDELKIFFCSRTHSQLTQFANELRRVQLPPVLPPLNILNDKEANEPEECEEMLKHLTLGSRKNLCINSKVNRLGSATAINERCLELQQSGTSSDRRCPHLPTKENEALVQDFRDNTLAKIRDIEDLGDLGKKLGICPYYASRPTIRPSEIVTLPYPLLLQKSAREALDLSLKDHVVIIDEAHNLMDAIAGIYSVFVSLKQLQTSRAQLGIYLQKFRNRLKGKNRVYLAQIIRLLDSLIQYLQSQSAKEEQKEGIIQPGDLMAGKGVDQIDLYKLVRYLQESKLARKVDGYIVHAEDQKQAAGIRDSRASTRKQPRAEASVPVLTQIQSFIVALMNPSSEGRFFYAKEGDSSVLKYLLLDPAHHFREIVEEARAVVLAGGTMSPMSDYYEHLFPYLPKSKIQTLSCGHVIPSSNLLAMPVSQAAVGAEFDFTFERRNSEAMISHTGKAILSVMQNTPDGVVAFFPSYAYLGRLVSLWKRPDSSGPSLWDKMTATKSVFLEPRASSSDSALLSPNEGHAGNLQGRDDTAPHESILASYAAAVASNNGRGALLLSVIGGSLSEGINFSDALGRAVIVVGLPFPNPHSAEWKAKAAYVEAKAAVSQADPKAASRDFYENVCMRAVNQCIGRAIRHKNDYAAILLLDRRYGLPRIRDKLPGWIKESLREPRDVGKTARELREFFKAKGIA